MPFRLMVSLLYLKHAFNESDEGVVERWAETPIDICPHVRRLWNEGYTAQQIAGLVRRPLSDIKLMTERMPRQARAVFQGRKRA